MTVSFKLAALDFHVPEKNQHAYKLEGFEDDWINLGSNRTAIFTQVPPGKYTFRAKAANSDRVWNEKGISLKIIITPPWWAYGLFGLVFIDIVLGMYRYELKRHRLTLD